MTAVTYGPNDFHVTDRERGTLGPGLGHSAPVMAPAVATGAASGVVETPDVKELKARAKTLSAAEKELERERKAFEAEKAAFAAARKEAE